MPVARSVANSRAEVLARYTGGRVITPQTTLEELGLSSLERVELMMELGIPEAAFTEARTVAQLTSDEAPRLERPAAPIPLPRWNRRWLARWIRDVSLATWILPLGRLFMWVRAEGLENLRGLEGPVIFAPNHQSHFDVPAILIALPFGWRRRVAPAMSKEFFTAHFHPERTSRWKRFTNSLNYWLSTEFFNAFPLPQREAGALDALRYAGELSAEGWCVLIFPEGKRTMNGEIAPFQPGVAMMGSRLEVPVVPVRVEGLDQVLHQTWTMARPGRVRVAFGKPLKLRGDDFRSLAAQVERAVREL